MKAPLTLEDFLTSGRHGGICHALHMHVLLEAHMPARCFNNSNQLRPHSRSVKARHTNSVTTEVTLLLNLLCGRGPPLSLFVQWVSCENRKGID